MAEILVEFVPDFSKLEAGVDQLVSSNTISKEMAALFTDAGKSLDQFGAKFAKLGGGNTLKPAIDAAKKSISDLSKSGITDLGELKKRVDGITNSFVNGFGEGVEQALKEAGISLEQFNNILKKTTDVDKSLKQELREINEEMARLKLNGQDNSQRYQELSRRAGEYRDTLQDVNEEINRQASDTGKLDVAIRFVSGLASAYSVLQGIQGLVGKDNEELQKTLLKVNSAMAILNGLQSIQNELKRKDSILTIAQTAIQKAYTLAVGTSTGALKVFRVALASTGIGLLVVGLGFLIQKIMEFTSATDGAADAQERFNQKLEDQQKLLSKNLKDLDNDTKLRILDAKRRGASEEELNQITLDGINKRKIAISKELNDLKFRLQIVNESLLTVDKESKASEKLTEEKTKLSEAVRDLNQQYLDLDMEGQTLLIDQQTEATEKATKATEKANDAAAKAAEQRKIREAEARRRALEDEVALQKQKLLLANEGSIAQLEAQRKVASAELALALDNDKLTFNQRKLLVQQFFSDQKELSKQFNEQNRKQVVEDQLTNIKTQLNALNLSNEERTRLTIEQLEIEKAEELLLVKNNETKRAEIISRFDKEIFDQRKKLLQDSFEEDLELTRLNFAQRKAILEEDIDNEKLPTEKRKAALQELTSFELTEFAKRRKNNQDQLKLAGIGNEEALKEFSKNAIKIDNDEKEAKKKNEKTFTDFTEGENDKRLKNFQSTVAVIAEFANQAIGSLRGFLDTMAANEDARIEAQKDSLEKLRNNGIISQKEYEARLKVIDRLDRDTKNKQAVREKQLALFEALVNGAAAIVKVAGEGPVAIVATSILVAAQIAAIAARQVPKFGKGTKSAPKGLAEVGETGTEIIQTKQGYFVADHPQIVWFKGGERVYNPNETKDILTPQANMTVINNSNGNSHNTEIDYDKMAKKFGDEIAKHPRLINNIDANGYSLFIQEGLNKSKYLNNRFTFK